MKQRLLLPAIHRRPRVRRGRRGQSLAEFALVLPTLLLFIMGVVDFGRLLFTYAQASSQLRQALRMASVIGYDPAVTPPYRDCDLMRDIADNVFFANSITPTVTYFDQVTDWSGSDFTGGTVCPDTGGADVGPTNLENGDVLRISENITVNLITPFFVPSVTFTLTGQRSVVTQIVLVSMPRCGDRICQSGETSCPADCVGSDTPPSVNILNPAHGSPCSNVTVSGSSEPVDIAASDSEDAAGTLTVELSINGGAWFSSGIAWNGTTYHYIWDTTSLTNGQCYTLQARATDSGGSTVVSTVHSVLVNNTSNTAPSVTITAPTANIFGGFTVEANATDAEDAAGTLTVAVTITPNVGSPVSGTLSYSGSGTIYSNNTFNTSSFPSATSATITVTVTDSGGLTATASTTVPVGACSPSCTPTVTITSPVGAATVMGSVPIDITVSDENPAPLSPVNVTIVQVSTGTTVVTATATYVSGNNYSYTWNTAGLTNGQYTVTASYNDGSSTGSNTITVTVSNSVSFHTNGLSWSRTGTTSGESSYTASIVVTVVDNNGAPQSGVTVSFTYGYSSSSLPYTSSCTSTTNSSGQCTLVIPLVSKTNPLYFYVSSATHATKTYDSASNIPPVSPSPTLCVISAPGNNGPAASGTCP